MDRGAFMTDGPVFDRKTIQRRFGRAASGYAQRARLQAEVAGRLLERLDGLKFSPEIVVDLGCGPGLQARALSERYRDARVVALDLALPMLHEAKKQAGWRGRRFRRVAADATALPLAESSVDLIYSNLMLQWCEDLPSVLNGLRRALRPGGLLLVSTFGPDTLNELRDAWAAVDDGEHVSRFTDVQTVGDCLVRAGFQEPVLDTDWFTTLYKQPRDVLDELRAIGANHALRRRDAGLTAPGTLRRMLDAYETRRQDDGHIPATWEVVYASAWAPEPGTPIRSIHGGEEASVPIQSIGRRRREPETS
jgi:malonyl-CoA O-methyltransferase